MEKEPSLVYAPIVVINTIINDFFKYRGVKYSGKLTDDEIITQMEDKGHVKLMSDKIVVVVTEKDHKCSKEKNEFINIMKFIKDLPTEINEIIIVLDKDIIESKKNITSEIIILQQTYPKLHIIACPYIRFTFNILAHKDVGEYNILSRDEITELTKIKHLNLSDIKVILESDPPILWIGARKGDIVSCKDKSLTVKKKIEYYMIK